MVDRAGCILYTSPSVTRWLGYEQDALGGQPLVGFLSPADWVAVSRALTGAVALPLVLGHQVRAADGSWRAWESSFAPLRDDPVGAVLITGRDVTERVALQRQQQADRLALEEQREKLELDRRVSQRLEAVGQLAAGIAHEINTPLQFVGDSVSFLSEAVDELLTLTGRYRQMLFTEDMIPIQERRQALEQAEQVADLDYLRERLPAAFARTVDGIGRVREIVLAMKRFSHAGPEETAPADLNAAIETTLAVCRNEYKYVAQVAFTAGELPLVKCCVGEINQVLLNLIINAAQAIDEHRAGTEEMGRIWIETVREGACAVVRIADDGPGIPRELQDRIYEPFFTTKEVGKGTGQGLALARTTIERHAGSLSCDSSPGHGTVFTIRLPLGGASGETQRALPTRSRGPACLPGTPGSAA